MSQNPQELKAENEAPEKIWIHTFDGFRVTGPLAGPTSEYIRADVVAAQLAELEPRWIAVTDQMPDKSGPVYLAWQICDGSYDRTEGIYYETRGWAWGIGVTFKETVTHWMPRLTPPPPIAQGETK